MTRGAAVVGAPRADAPAQRTAVTGPARWRRRWMASTWLATAAVLLAGCAGNPPLPESGGTETSVPRAGNPPFYRVNGRRYHLLETAEGYRERGVASWYGTKFHGRPTASGEIYDMYALTAAHKTLPIPSWVHVRNLENGREVVLRVNDRGPFVKNRLIDLSYEAARRLEVIGPGTALVEVRVVPDPSGATLVKTAHRVPARPVSLPAGAPDGFFVQVGAFSDEANAARMQDRLRALGFDNVVVQQGGPPEPAYRVQVGPFTDVEAYDAIVDRMAAGNIHDTFLTVR